MPDTDRELLELAAKAAGIEYALSGGQLWTTMCGSIHRWTERWNPLHNDGQALRLACSLRINIEHAETLARKPHGVNCWPVGRGDCGHMENELADYGAATRRAIVRAAAAIGQAMDGSDGRELMEGSDG